MEEECKKSGRRAEEDVEDDWKRSGEERKNNDRDSR